MRHYVRPQPEELRDRRRHLSARLLHDEAQSAPQREDGAAARLRRHPPAAAALDRAGRHRADRRARPLAPRDDRHGLGGDEPQGRRPWRALRHDGDQGGARGARREAHDRAGAGIGPRHQPGDRGAPRLPGRRRARAAPTAPSTRRRCTTRLGAGRRRDHAHQPQHLRPVRARRRSRSPTRCTPPAPTSTPTAPTSTPSSAR